MGVITISLNDMEQKVLDDLVEHHGVPQSTVFKKAILELYESMLDKKDIEIIEKERQAGKDKWLAFEELEKVMLAKKPEQV